MVSNIKVTKLEPFRSLQLSICLCQYRENLDLILDAVLAQAICRSGTLGPDLRTPRARLSTLTLISNAGRSGRQRIAPLIKR